MLQLRFKVQRANHDALEIKFTVYQTFSLDRKDQIPQLQVVSKYLQGKVVLMLFATQI
jgi:hypothetical protein